MWLAIKRLIVLSDAMNLRTKYYQPNKPMVEGADTLTTVGFCFRQGAEMEKVYLRVNDSKSGSEIHCVSFLIDKNDIDNFLRICKENQKYVEIEFDYTEEE